MLKFSHIALVLLWSSAQLVSADVYQEKKGLVAIELENTSSKLGKWEKGEKLKGFTGKGYLQFTGNQPKGGKANSPIEYRFKITKAGLYHLHLHCAKQTVDGRSDLANDCYIRVEGDYEAGPKAGDSHKSLPFSPLSASSLNQRNFPSFTPAFFIAAQNSL